MAAEAPTLPTPKPAFKAREEGNGEWGSSQCNREDPFLNGAILLSEKELISQMSSYISFVTVDYIHGQFYFKKDWKVSVYLFFYVGEGDKEER